MKEIYSKCWGDWVETCSFHRKEVEANDEVDDERTQDGDEGQEFLERRMGNEGDLIDKRHGFS